MHPQLFFHCMLRSIGATVGSYNRCNEDIPLDLVFFSSFEELRLRLLESWNQREFTGYTSPHLFPLSLSEGLRTSSAELLSSHAFWTDMQPQNIPHKYSSRQKDAFECGCADGWGPNSRRGCYVYKMAVDLWTAPASRGRPLCGQN